MDSDLNFDVLVCGAGPSGVAASVSSARAGAKTLLIERYGFPGGAATAALVNPFMISKKNSQPLIRGFFSEIIEALAKDGACADGELFGQPHTVFDPEQLKFILLELLESSQAKLLFHTSVIGAIINKNEIKGVLANGKGGDVKILAKVIIDATGDGDIAYMSGAPFEKGREDSLMQPASIMFRVAGVDEQQMPSRDEMNALYVKARNEGRIRSPRENLLWFETTRKGELHFNTTRIVRIDGTSSYDLTKAEIEGRKQVRNIFNFLRSSVPGFKNAYISAVAPQVGIRESRRITGDYVLTRDDVLGGAIFDDTIAKCNYPIDIHSPSGAGTIFTRLGQSIHYTIPFRCLLPKKIENLIVTGRAISVTHEALSSVRVMSTCTALGQAAGTAAAIAVKKRTAPRKVRYDDLAKVLIDNGADI